jgi:hypothetical protein
VWRQYHLAPDVPSGEVLTAHFFITKPLYLKWMFQLTDVERLMKQD